MFGVWCLVNGDWVKIGRTKVAPHQLPNDRAQSIKLESDQVEVLKAIIQRISIRTRLFTMWLAVVA